MQSTTPCSLGDQRPLVFGHGPADLKEQLILGVVGQRAIGELDLAPVTLEFLEEEDLMDVVAGQPIGIGDQDPIEFGQGREVAEFVQTGSPE
jgi:hypothetical protein